MPKCANKCQKVAKGGSHFIGATIRTCLLCVMFSSLFKYSESSNERISENIKMYGVKSIFDKKLKFKCCAHFFKNINLGEIESLFKLLYNGVVNNK